jgi:hypothetical protein
LSFFLSPTDERTNEQGDSRSRIVDPDTCVYDAHIYDPRSLTLIYVCLMHISMILDPWLWSMCVCMVHVSMMRYFSVTDERTDKAILGVGCNDQQWYLRVTYPLPTNHKIIDTKKVFIDWYGFYFIIGKSLVRKNVKKCQKKTNHLFFFKQGGHGF